MGYDLYVITDTKLSGGRSHEEIARLAADGGADVVQLRDKTAGAKELVAAGKRIREITHRKGVLFVVNDRLDIALACGADGVHLGQGDLPARTARALVPGGFVIGVSAGTPQEAAGAAADGADYIAAGPVFPTASKEDAGPCIGLSVFREIRAAAAGVPLIAIGGIGLHNAREVILAGGDGIAVISAVVAQPDISGAARELKNRILECKRERSGQRL
jgi:thiamine-phosphate pyrophosphorylase